MAMLFNAMVLVFVMLSSGQASTKPTHHSIEPMTLIRGVQATRESLKSGRFEYKVKVKFNIPGVNSPMDHDHFTMSFLDKKLRLEQSSTKYITYDSNLPFQSKQDARISRPEGDTKRKQGWDKWSILSIYDGTQMIQTAALESSHNRRVFYSEPAGPGFVQHGFFIDPRLMGLCVSGGADESVASCLYLDKIKSMILIGKEVIGANEAWHIQCAFSHVDSELHLWIGDVEGFPIYRVISKSSNSNEINMQIDSEYKQPVSKYFIPVKVHRRSSIDANGKARIDMLFEEVSSDYAPHLQAEFFSIKGMNLPPGTSITDARIKKLVGYWDGEKITQDINAINLAPTQLAQVNAARINWKWWGIFAGCVLGLILLVWFVIRIRQRYQATAS